MATATAKPADTAGKKRIVVMISGGGTGLQAVLDACADGRINGQVVQVISSSKKAYGLQRAKQAGVPACAITKRDYPTMQACNLARHRAIRAAKPDLVLLAGYLGIVSGWTVRAFAGKIINIHPSLIPSFCGKGFHGSHVHQAVLARGAKVSGCTTHFVDRGIDSGPIIAQRTIPVLPGDTPETLAARLSPVEHGLLVDTVAAFCDDRIVVQNGLAAIIP